MFYFCYGNSPSLEFEIDRIMKDITQKYENISTKFFDFSFKDEEENFFNNIQSNSIFNSLEFLILKRTENIKSTGIVKLMKSIKSYDISQKIILISYNLPMLYDKPVAEYELTKTAIKNIEEIATLINCISIKNKDEILSYIKKNIKITDNDAKKLADILGNDYYSIKNEVDKISIFLGEEEYSFDKIKNLISIDVEYNIKELVENFFKTNTPNDLIKYLNKNKDTYMLLMYILGDELINFLKISSLLRSGKINKNMNYNVFKEIYNDFSNLFIGRNYKVFHPYVIFLKLTNFPIKDENFYVQKLKELLEIEYRMKNGNGNIEIELPLFLMRFI